MMETSFSTYSATQFLVFYALLGAAALAASLWLGRTMRPQGRDSAIQDASEWAYLAGGAKRLSAASLARLLGSGAISVEAHRTFAVDDPHGGHTDLERDLLEGRDQLKAREAQAIVSRHAPAIERRLIEKRLLLSHGERGLLRLTVAAPFLAVLAVGSYRARAGAAENEPIGHILELSLLFLVVMGIRLFCMKNRTQAGEAALVEGRSAHFRLQQAPQATELDLGVALFGTAVLVGTPYSPLHAMRQSGGGGGCGGSGGGDDGGSGCGGGCGGCGG